MLNTEQITMDELFGRILAERGGPLGALITKRTGLGPDAAQSFLNQTLEQLTGALRGGRLDPAEALGGRTEALIGSLNLELLAEACGIETQQAQAGLEGLAPELGQALDEQFGGPAGIAKLLRGSGGGLKGLVGKLLD